MIHYIALYRLASGKTEEEIEAIIRLSRTCFHRTREARRFRSGRSIDKKEEYDFFVSADFESRDMLRMFREDPGYLRFEAEVVAPHTAGRRELVYETEPGKNPKFS